MFGTFDCQVGRLQRLYLRESTVSTDSNKTDTIAGLAYLREFTTSDDMSRSVSIQFQPEPGPSNGAAVSAALAAGPGGLLAMGVSPHSAFKDMKLCTTVEELDTLADDHSALNFQVEHHSVTGTMFTSLEPPGGS